ncbi:MAG: hypothetical protein WCO35_00115 [Candidatus Nomurabacteria bacterium]
MKNGFIEAKALETKNGNFFFNCGNLCFFAPSGNSLLSISTSEHWEYAEKNWNTPVLEKLVYLKVINSISKAIDVDESYTQDDLVEGYTYTEIGKRYIIYQPDGNIEKIIYITGRNLQGTGYEPLPEVKIIRFINGLEVKKIISDSKKRVSK